MRLYFTILLLVFSGSLFSQNTATNNITLPRLLVDNRGMEVILNDIDAYIGNKPNGLQYPVTKIVFSKFDDIFCYHIVGIDNSWTDLFKFGEVPYGYLVVYNRLFLVVKEGYHNIDLNDLFLLTDNARTFNKFPPLPPTGYTRRPTWFFEYKDRESYLISVTDLEVLD